MNYKLKLTQCRKISFSDIELSPPTIPIFADNNDSPFLANIYLWSCMIYPNKNQSTYRRKLILLLFSNYFLNNNKNSNVLVEPSVLEILISNPALSYDNFIKVANQSSQKGHIAGVVLYYIHQLFIAQDRDIFKDEPSLNKAIYFVQKLIADEQKHIRKDKHKLPISYDQILRYWNEYRLSAHLWLSAYLLKFHCKGINIDKCETNNPMELLKDTRLYGELFKISEYFRKFGENFTYRNMDKNIKKHIFEKNEAWRPSPNLETGKLESSDFNISHDDLADLIISWNKRKK